jgi:hypothetical protein
MRSFAKSDRIFYALKVRPQFGQSLFPRISFARSTCPVRSNQPTVTVASFFNNSAKPSKSGRNLYSYNSAKSAMVIRLVTHYSFQIVRTSSNASIAPRLSSSPFSNVKSSFGQTTRIPFVSVEVFQPRACKSESHLSLCPFVILRM